MARNRNTPNTSNTKPATQAHDASATQANEVHDEAGEAGDDDTAPATQGSQWAREKARAIAQGGSGKAAHRFAKLADVLIAAREAGEARLSFAQANERAALRRGATGDAAASWRLALQRTRQVFGAEPAVAGWRVDAESGALVYAGE